MSLIGVVRRMFRGAGLGVPIRNESTMAERAPLPGEMARNCATRTLDHLPSAPAGSQAAPMPAGASSKAFLAILREELGADELRWDLALNNYRLLARQHGWPMLSEQALSKELCRQGCELIPCNINNRARRCPMVLRWSGRRKQWARPIQLSLPFEK